MAINIDLPNVAGIQVLKGPQGTLYGRNATGGAILLNTLDPSDTLKGRVELTYGRFDDKRASAYISGPLSETIAISRLCWLSLPLASGASGLSVWQKPMKSHGTSGVPWCSSW